MRATDGLGGACAFVTLTVRHDLSLPLAEAKRIVSEASRAARGGAPWKRIQAHGDLQGVVQGVEVLHSQRTGWHYHLHLLIPGLGPPEAVREAAERLIARYIGMVEKRGGSALRQGQDVQLVTLGDERDVAGYAAKGSASWEVAGGAKAARGRASRTPWDLVTLAACGDTEAERLFREYAETMPGTRSCVVSPALARALDLAPDEDDDEPGEQQLDDADSIVGELPSPIWRRTLFRGTAWRVLRAVEDERSWTEVEALARELGAPPPPPPLREDRLDVSRVVRAAVATGSGSTAARSRRLDELVAEERRQAAQRGGRLRVDRGELERGFIDVWMQGGG